MFTANRSCDPVRGGLVVGNVRGATGRAGINGATVTSLDKPDEKAVTAATPDDPGLDDGFYWMFSQPDRTTPVRGARRSSTRRRPARSTWPPTGRRRRTSGSRCRSLTVTPTSLQTTSVLGGDVKSKTFTVTNDGTAPVDVEFAEQPGGFVLQTPDGNRVDTDRSPRRRVRRCRRSRPTCRSRSSRRGWVSTGSPAAPVGPNEAPWTDIADYPSTVMDNRVVYVDGVAYSIGGGSGSASYDTVFAYDPATLAWTEKASLPGARNAMSVGAVNGQIVATGGWAAAGPSADTWVYDPAGDAWSAGGRCSGVAVGVRAGRGRRQAVRRRRLHHLGVHADVERRGCVRPGDRHLGAARRLPGAGRVRVLRRDRREGLLHRRQRRCGGHGGQLRLRPGCRLVDARSRTPRSTPGRAATPSPTGCWSSTAGCRVR